MLTIPDAGEILYLEARDILNAENEFASLDDLMR